jgi:hypothetical protein
MVARRILTMEQVNDRLPLVEAIVRDIVSLHADIASRRSRLETFRSRRPASSGLGSAYEEEVQQMKDELLRDERRLNDYTDELAGIGGQISDPALGRVDFLSELGHDPVWLCWQLGEARVMYWHAGPCDESERIPICHATETSG